MASKFCGAVWYGMYNFAVMYFEPNTELWGRSLGIGGFDLKYKGLNRLFTDSAICFI
jgi:hypothetical protein